MVNLITRGGLLECSTRSWIITAIISLCRFYWRMTIDTVWFKHSLFDEGRAPMSNMKRELDPISDSEFWVSRRRGFNVCLLVGFLFQTFSVLLNFHVKTLYPRIGEHVAHSVRSQIWPHDFTKYCSFRGLEKGLGIAHWDLKLMKTERYTIKIQLIYWNFNQIKWNIHHSKHYINNWFK